MLEYNKTFHPKPKNTDELKTSLAVNMGPAAASLNQQSHSGPHNKKIELLCKLGWIFWTWFQINCVTSFWIRNERRCCLTSKLQVNVKIFFEIGKYWIEYLNSYNLRSNNNTSENLSEIVETSFPSKSWHFGRQSSNWLHSNCIFIAPLDRDLSLFPLGFHPFFLSDQNRTHM